MVLVCLLRVGIPISEAGYHHAAKYVVERLGPGPFFLNVVNFKLTIGRDTSATSQHQGAS